MTALRLTLLGTWGLLGVLMLLGLSLQLGWRRGGTAAHHVLYFLVTLGTALALLLAWRAGAAWWPLLVLLALLLGMSRTRPGKPGHWRLATVIFVLYSGAAWWLW